MHFPSLPTPLLSPPPSPPPPPYTHPYNTQAFLSESILVEFNIWKSFLSHGIHCHLYSCALENQGQQLWTFVLGENSRGEFETRSNYSTRGLRGSKVSNNFRGLRIRGPGLNPAQLQLGPNLKPVALVIWASDYWHKMTS